MKEQERKAKKERGEGGRKEGKKEGRKEQERKAKKERGEGGRKEGRKEQGEEGRCGDIYCYAFVFMICANVNFCLWHLWRVKCINAVGFGVTHSASQFLFSLVNIVIIYH